MSNDPMPLAPFSLGEIVIVQALRPGETPTGEILHGFVASRLEEAGSGIGLRLVNVQSPGEFVEFVDSLVDQAASGRIPLLHVECHGDDDDGLHFPNGEDFSWYDLGRAISPLNRATRFNLVTVFSACYGAHSIGQAAVGEPAPFYFMIGPTSEVSSPEIMRGMRDLYRTLVTTSDLGLACLALEKLQLEQGGWFCKHVQTWFVEIVDGYFKDLCTEAAMAQRVRDLYRQHLADGKHVGPGRIRRRLRKLNNTNPTGPYFDSFFMVADFPENAARFAPVKVKLAKRMDALRRTGRYVL